MLHVSPLFILYSSIKRAFYGCCAELLCPALSLLAFGLIQPSFWAISALQLFWKKKYCVMQLNVSSAFCATASVFFLDNTSYLIFFVPSLVSTSPLWLLFYTSVLFSSCAYLVYVVVVTQSQPELSAWHLADPALCLLSLSVQTCISAYLSALFWTEFQHLYRLSYHDLFSFTQFKILLHSP